MTGNLNSGNKIYFGNKEQKFEKSYCFEAKHETSSIKVVDLNKDGFLDIIEGNFEDRNYVYMGSENGDFKEIGLREDLKDDTYNIEIGDINNDGLLDIIESNSESINYYYKTQKK